MDRAGQGRLWLSPPVPPSEALGGISTALFVSDQHHHLPPIPLPLRPEETVSGICRGEGRREDSPPPLRKSRTFSKKKITLLTFIPIQCLSVKRHPWVPPRGRWGAVESRAPRGAGAAPNHTSGQAGKDFVQGRGVKSRGDGVGCQPGSQANPVAARQSHVEGNIKPKLLIPPAALPQQHLARPSAPREAYTGSSRSCRAAWWQPQGCEEQPNAGGFCRGEGKQNIVTQRLNTARGKIALVSPPHRAADEEGNLTSAETNPVRKI